MKKLSVFILSFVVAALCAFGAKCDDSKSYVVAFADAPLKVVSASKGVDARASTFETFDKVVKNVVRVNYKNSGDGWENVSFAIVSPKDCALTLGLASAHCSRLKDGSKPYSCAYYDDVKVDGKLLPNGDFENGFDGWSSGGFPSGIVSRVSDSGKCLRTWYGTYIQREIPLKANVPAEISFRTKPAGILTEDDRNVACDISRIANFSMSDFKKFGVNFDLSKFDFSRKDFGGVKFKLLSPSANGGKIGVVLASKSYPDYPKKISLGDPSGRYLYLLHTGFYCDGSSVNTGVVKITGADGIVETHLLQRRRDTWLFNDSREYHANVFPVWRAFPDKKIGNIFLSRFELPKKTAVSSIEIESASNDALLILGATVSDLKIATIPLIVADEKHWVRADIPESIFVKKDSALDQSKFFDSAPAGTYGRVIVSERGTLAFEKNPDEDVRFKGFSEYSIGYFMKMPRDIRNAAITRYVDSFKANGYNFARISFEPLRDFKLKDKRAEYFEISDFLLSELKRNGVYVHLTLVWYKLNLEDYSFYLRDDVKLRAVFGDPNVRAHWKSTVEELLNHVNPYTGLAWKDDPVFICAEYYNELAICFSRMDKNSKFHPNDTILPETEKLVLQKWRAWLKARYKGDISALDAAWKKYFGARAVRAHKNFDEVECIVKGNPDWEMCCWDNLADFVRFAEKVVNDTGYKGIKVQNNLGMSAYGISVRNATSDYVIANTYYAHPSSFNIDDAMCSQSSPTAGGASYWRGIASNKINNRPFFVTEYNHCFWNKYRYELPAMFSAYSAFQNFSGLVMHASAVPIDSKPPKRLGSFSIAESPVARASELFSSAFFIRGDVKKAKRRVDMVLGENFLKNSTAAQRGLNTKQTLAALMTGFANSFETPAPKALSNVKIPKPALSMKPVGGSEMISEAWYQSVVESSSAQFDPSKLVSALREKKILPESNLSDADAGIYQTDTGQITIDIKNLWLKVKTPRSVIYAAEKPVETELGAFKLVSSSESCSAGVCSLDGKKISKSKRLMLVYITREGNMGMKLSPDEVMSIGQGSGPISLRKGVLEAELKLSPDRQYEVFPLALDGTRREPLPFDFVDGVMKIKIDNSKLEHGATVFFEICAK